MKVRHKHIWRMGDSTREFVHEVLEELTQCYIINENTEALHKKSHAPRTVSKSDYVIIHDPQSEPRLQDATGPRMSDVVLAAGRELDALVAEKVMEWKRIFIIGNLSGGEHNPVGERQGSTSVELVPHYSTAMAAAWEVVEKLGQQGYEMNLRMILPPRAQFHCCFARVTIGKTIQDFDSSPKCCAVESTVPLAICLAALKAVEQR